MISRSQDQTGALKILGFGYLESPAELAPHRP